MKKWLAGVLVMITLTPGVIHGIDLVDIPALRRQAIELYEAGQYKAALPLYQDLAALQPTNTNVLKDLLTISWLAERYGESVIIAKRLLPRAPNDFDAWFIYARALLAVGRKEEAFAAFKRCEQLEPEEKAVQFSEARVALALHDYETALSLFIRLRQRYPDYTDVYAELAKTQQATGLFMDAARSWTKAVSFSPENRSYQFHQAECLFYSGQKTAAMPILESLSSAKKRYWPAIDFLVGERLVNGDRKAAETRLQDCLTEPRLDDEQRLLLLTQLYMQDQAWDRAVAILDRWLALTPDSGKARLLKAECFNHQGHSEAALKLYQDLLRRNPSSLSALLGQAEVESSLRRPAEATSSVAKALALDPTDPYLLIRKSQYLYEKGDTLQSSAELRQWLRAHPDQGVPVLLYHGLTPVDGDPILANPLNRSTAVFEDHLRALQEAGFKSVSAEQVNAWLHGQGPLPKRPVLITFDDARLDSLQYADPLLKKYGFQATMFVPLVNVEGYLAKYATWKDLERYQATGRWELQFHGDQAHKHIAIDAQGRQGLYLINKRWMDNEQRLETDAEWTARIRDDHKSGKEKMAHHTGRTPVAFSFPEGNFGQDDIPNTLQAAPVNIRQASEAFGSVYHQDGYGINPSSRDPAFLTRYEPEQGMTGRALVRHLIDSQPTLLMRRSLLRQAAWDERVHEAYGWLSELTAQDASPVILETDEARIRLAEGDLPGARRLAEAVAQEEDSPEIQSILEAIRHNHDRRYAAGFEYAEDNRTRVSRRFRQDLGAWQADGWRLSLHHIFGSYSESGISTVQEHGGGLGVARALGQFHQLSVEGTGHFFTEAAERNTFSLTGEVDSEWNDDLRSEVSGGRSTYDTARAIESNVISHYIQGVLHWAPRSDWRARARIYASDLSDDNHRASGLLEASRQLLGSNFWLVGRAILDSTTRISPNYYSPQLLQTYQLGFQYERALSEKIKWSILYLPGYGKEKNSDQEFVQDLDTGLSWAFTRSLTLRPSFALVHTPTYHRNTYSAELVYRF